MANKKIRNSKGEVFETDVAARMSQEFDREYDVRNTFTFRMICNMTGCRDDAVRTAIMLAMKRAGSNSSNVKIRFTMEFAVEHMDEIIALAKTVQLENEARILEVRKKLSTNEQKNGKRIALQNYALMILRSNVTSTVSDDNLNLALKKTGNWYTPDSAVFNLKLDFAGVTSESSGLNLEKEIDVTDSDGMSGSAFRVITEVGGMKSCPVSNSNKNEMSDMLFDILKAYAECFKDVKGSDMDKLLEALKNFVGKYRTHDNTGLIDTRLTEEEKKKAKLWAESAHTWLIEN